MIQFNLLPDVKLAYIKADRTKNLVISISTIVGAVALGIFVLLFITVDVVQKKNLNDLNTDIKTASSKLENSPNLNKVLTVQNQLSTLNGLHAQKPMSSRLFGYLGQVTPSSITISNVTTDFTQHTVSISGGAPSLDAVNTLVDTLKFTTYSADGNTSSAPTAFSQVVLTSFSRSTKNATYTVTFNYDPTIFDITRKVTLTVPNTVTTRSVTEQPTDLFKAAGTQ